MTNEFPNFVRIHNAIAGTYLELKKADEAITWYQKGIEKNDKYYPLLYGLAMAHNVMGNQDTAIRLSEQSISMNPRHHEPYTSLGDAYFLKGQFQQA